MPIVRLKHAAVLGAAAAVLAAVLAAGCSDSTSPSTADPSTMATTVTSFNASLAQNSVFQSLIALDGSAALGVAVARAALPATGPWTRVDAGTRRALSVLAAQAPAAALALFPANVLGKTFQWDSTNPAGYRITDSTLTGAPSTGVRFILYQVDTATGQPSQPLMTTGYIDLADVSTAQANALHLVLKVGSQTAADYTISEVKTTSSLSLTAAGYVVNVVSAGAKVNFNLTHVLSLSDSSLSTNYQANDGSTTVSLVSVVTDSGGSLDWTASKGGSMEIVGYSGDTINIKFKLNGTTIAVATGTPDDASVTGPDGAPLSETDLLALYSMLDGFASIYYNLSLVFVPSLLVFV